MTVQLYLGDCLDILPTLAADSVDTIITDPPYGLEFMGKDWDQGVPGVRFWREALRVAKPGATMLAFGGTRTHHRLMCAIEDAGWELRDVMMWLYGSGFPKSHDISKAIDKAAGAERENLYLSPNRRPGHENGKSWKQSSPDSMNYHITAPATPEAVEWEGWGTALKPAFEPIVLCRKPLTPVPFDGILSEVQNLIGGALCLLLSNVNNAGEISRLSPSVPGGASVSALMIAAVLHGAESGELYEKMDMFNSRETALTCLNIATLWSGILDGLSKHGSTFTTETETEVIIGLRTLRYLLSVNMPAEVILGVSHLAGCASSVNDAGKSLTSGGVNTNKQNDTFAAALVSLNTAESGTLARNAAGDLQAIIPSVVSALNHVRQLSTIDEGENLVPDWRPIIVAMKPRDGTFANNALTWGVAGLWIDGGRIPTNGEETGRDCSRQKTPKLAPATGWNANSMIGLDSTGHGKGRWPANLILDEAAAEMLGAQSGERGQLVQGNYKRKSLKFPGSVYEHSWTREDGNDTGAVYSDTGTAARFFYCAKASRAERTNGGTIENKHPTVKPLALMRYLCRLTKTPTGGTVLDLFMGSGSTGVAAVEEGRPFIGIEKERPAYETAEQRIEAARAEAQLQPALL